MTIFVTPELDIPPPFKMSDEEILDLHERAHRAFKTVEFLAENGLDDEALVPTEEDKKDARALFTDNPVTTENTHAYLNTPGKALVLQALLNEYDVEVVRNAAQVRNYVKMRLLELSDDRNAKVQLKALELLGKMSDVQAFTDRVEINITHRTTEELEEELATKLAAYMGDIVDVESRELEAIGDVPPLPEEPQADIIDVDEELGFAGGEIEKVEGY
jgi:hypothetical protein